MENETQNNGKFYLNVLFGHSEILTKFEPCKCGRIGCGINYGRHVTYGGNGDITHDTGWEPSLIGFYDGCNGKPIEKTWIERVLEWLKLR